MPQTKSEIRTAEIIDINIQQPPNASLQLRRAISIHPRRNKTLEKHAIAPSAARLLLDAFSI